MVALATISTRLFAASNLYSYTHQIITVRPR